MKMEQTGCSETLAFRLQTPGNDTEESIRQQNYFNNERQLSVCFIAEVSMFPIIRNYRYLYPAKEIVKF
jgi:hypothetical protein